ncbi:MAG TPA: tetratricopeptide repeat protein [Vicinamibacterales bacterium]|nr:tetratricopeptide repeat protein [Vicinamibacterales bacterium]
MGDYTLIVVLVALLVGLALGKAWERYKLQSGRLVDRRRLRDTPHYMLGLNFLADGQIDQAIDELTKAGHADGGALEVQMILGNLYRQKGQVGRAITVHQELLQRSSLTRLEHAQCLLCLALDFRHAGFIDRALAAFREVVRLDPQSRYALVNLQKLHEEQRQWAEAAQVRAQIAALETAAEHQQILGFLRNEIGSAQAAAGDTAAAAASFRDAIGIDPRTVPAYLSLGDVMLERGQLDDALASWEQLVREVPDRAYLAFDRLERAYRKNGKPARFVELCETLIARFPQDWRARLALSRHLACAGRHSESLDLLFAALPHNPHGLVVHQAIWEVLTALDLDERLVRRYVDLTREAVFYLDPHVCLRCRYRSTELLWQCPQCHEWNTFVEERIAAKDAPIAEAISSE